MSDTQIAELKEPQQPTSPDASGLSVAALVLGILSIVIGGMVLGIPALICGYQARRRMALGGQGSSGQAMAGIVLGWISSALSVVIAVILTIALGSTSNRPTSQSTPVATSPAAPPFSQQPCDIAGGENGMQTYENGSPLGGCVIQGGSDAADLINQLQVATGAWTITNGENPGSSYQYQLQPSATNYIQALTDFTSSMSTALSSAPEGQLATDIQSAVDAASTVTSLVNGTTASTPTAWTTADDQLTTAEKTLLNDLGS